jgi:hypothetical protein
MNKTTVTAKPATIRKFVGGTCEITPAKDSGNNWVKVRFDAQAGAGFQFECWNDEMHLLEADIERNFVNAKIVGLPLAAD